MDILTYLHTIEYNVICKAIKDVILLQKLFNQIILTIRIRYSSQRILFELLHEEKQFCT